MAAARSELTLRWVGTRLNQVHHAKFVCAICCATMSAQISHLATTSDGSVLYFHTNFELVGGYHSPGQQIIRYRDDTRTFEQCVPAAMFGGDGITPALGVANPDVTGDGSVVAWNVILGCGASDWHQCLGLPFENPVGLITASSFTGNLWSGVGSHVQLSRNGQYAATFGGSPRLIALFSGTSVAFGGAVYGAGESVSDAGAVVIAGSPPTLASGIMNGQISTMPLKFSQSPDQIRLSRDGRSILYESAQLGSIARLFFYDAVSGAEMLIATGPVVPNADPGSTFPYDYFSFFPCLDDSGTKVLYVNSPSPGSPPRVYLWDVGTAPPGRQIVTAPDGIGEAILSGSAQVAYATTLNNRLLRIDVASGATRELSGRVPTITSWFSASTAPGSLMQANGSGLLDAGMPADVTVGGVEAFVVSGTPAQVTFQIPWDFPLPRPDCAPETVSFGAVTNSVFTSGISVMLCSMSPSFILPALHQDFHGAVTEQDPSAPGEILHFFMTGLGPVSPQGRTGEIASGNPLQYAEPVSCTLEVNATSEVVTPSFAGLAPGLIGIYQLDLPLPADLRRSIVFLTCGYQNRVGNTSFYVQ